MEHMAAGGRLHQIVCRNVRAARLRAGLTQEEAAKRAKMSRPNYTYIELGKSELLIGTIERLAPAVKATVAELVDPNFAVAELVA
jgi:transcriptional regulator with XRE-family HTH domain